MLLALIESLMEDKDALNVEINELKREYLVKPSEQKLLEVQLEEIETLKSVINDLKIEVNDQKNLNNSLSGALESVTASNKQLEDTLEQKMNELFQIDTLKSTINDLQIEVKEQKNLSHSLSGALDTVVAVNKQLEEKFKNSVSENTKLKDTIKELKEEDNLQGNKVSKVKEELQAKQIVIEELQGEVSKLKKEILNLEEEQEIESEKLKQQDVVFINAHPKEPKIDRILIKSDIPVIDHIEEIKHHKSIKLHSSYVNALESFENNNIKYLITGSYDETIKVRNANGDFTNPASSISTNIKLKRKNL